MKPTWSVFSKTPTCAPFTPSVLLSCQRISNWHDESVANAPKLWKILYYINLHYYYYEVVQHHATVEASKICIKEDFIGSFTHFTKISWLISRIVTRICNNTSALNFSTPMKDLVKSCVVVINCVHVLNAFATFPFFSSIQMYPEQVCIHEKTCV